tara:strand:- start:24 stop:515 length:492 start_codon:yes stop_codon:yes gene_type:complete
MPLTKLNSASVIERLPTGSVLQTVQFSSTFAHEISSTNYTKYTGTWTDVLGSSVPSPTITCSSASNKVLILCELESRPWENNSHNCTQYQRIYRGTTAISRITTTRAYDYGGSGTLLHVSSVINHIDIPNSTNALTYELYFAKGTADRATILSASMTLQEIKG